MNDTAENTGGATPGGERTPPQDAGAALEDVNEQRRSEPPMERRQMAGEVASQTQHQQPAAANPESGFPAAITGEAVEQAEDVDG